MWIWVGPVRPKSMSTPAKPGQDLVEPRLSSLSFQCHIRIFNVINQTRIPLVVGFILTITLKRQTFILNSLNFYSSTKELHEFSVSRSLTGPGLSQFIQPIHLNCFYFYFFQTIINEVRYIIQYGCFISQFQEHFFEIQVHLN